MHDLLFGRLGVTRPHPPLALTQSFRLLFGVWNTTYVSQSRAGSLGQRP
jgi:hypothetical protein